MDYTKEAYLYRLPSGRCPFEEWLETLRDRVYFGEVGEAIVILLCGGDKSTQTKDIKAAHAYWADYWRRPHAAREKLS